MIYLLYNKSGGTIVNYPYFWILDYLTQQRCLKFNYCYILFNVYKIRIKNNQFLLKYHCVSKIIQLEPIGQFYKNFSYIKKSLKLTGVGYKIDYNKTDRRLILIIGYSHKVYVQLPIGIDYSINKEKNYIEFLSYNYILLTTVISKLKKLHKMDPYKGKGFKLLEEIFSPKFYKK